MNEKSTEKIRVVASQLGAQIFFDHRWRREGCTTLHLLLNDLARGFQNLVSPSPADSALGRHAPSAWYRTSEKDSCDMIVLRLLGRNCPEP